MLPHVLVACAVVQVQSWTPQLILQPLRQAPANGLVALLWCTLLIACPLFMGGMMQVRSREGVCNRALARLELVTG